MGVPLAMKEDTHGNVWIVTEYGLAVCNGEGDIQTTLRVDVHDISSMAIDGWGNLWLGTRAHVFLTLQDTLHSPRFRSHLLMSRKVPRDSHPCKLP